MKVIGLISGTSVDGIDAALVEITGTEYDLSVRLIHGETYSYDEAIRDHLLAIALGKSITLDALAALDDAVANAFGQAAIRLQSGQLEGDRAGLIGSHGQTVFHRPAQPGALGYSLQLGRGDSIAKIAGLPTVYNFRAADIARGGQGAPLVPPIDACLLGDQSRDRCVQNIGGISNATYLPAKGDIATQPWLAQILGWDTGPGNSLIDLAVARFSQGELSYDAQGAWAAQGEPRAVLVEAWLQDDYFQQLPPKSTGREWFGAAFLQRCLDQGQARQLAEADLLASLTDFTAAAIVQEYARYLPKIPDQVLLCGGGSRNLYLRERLRARLPSAEIITTDDCGLSVTFKEAIAFAVLAYWRWHGVPSNLPKVTGAANRVSLGEICLFN
ncbi:MAG: anhydro-N-acetylmuramic acid kinase [Cyanobacteria bacterium P01_D01_bin.128]